MTQIARNLHNLALDAAAGLRVPELLPMAAGLAVLAAALTASLGGAIGAVSHDPAVTLQQAAVQAGFDATVCPDGWAADHARILPMTEAEITSWYLAEAFTRSDAEVLAAVNAYLAAPQGFRQVEGTALTHNQINLCIAESRRMIPYPLAAAPTA
jgi:hypothetical protein